MKKLLVLVVIVFSSVFLSGCQEILNRHSKSGLQVITDDIPAAVFLNGQYINSTPLIEKELKPGEYTIKIEPTDHALQPYETNITLRKGLLTVVTWKPAERPELAGGVIYEMEKLKDSTAAEVSFVTVPEGAIINLEGNDKEFSPIVFQNVEAGNRSFEITLPSYETQNHTINVQPGFRMIVHVKLAKLQPIEESPSANSTQSAPNPTASESSTLTTPSSPSASATASSTLLGTSSAFLDK